MWNNTTQNQFQGGNSSQRQNVNVTTAVKTFMSTETQLVTSLWNTAISIKINRATGIDQNGNPVFERGFNAAGSVALGQTALTTEKAKSLVLGFKEKVLPVYEQVIAGTEICPDTLSVSVETGRAEKRNSVLLGMKATTDGTPAFFLIICNGLNDENIVADSNVYEHVFAKQEIKENYNYRTGGYDNSYMVEADFWNFINILESCSGIPEEYHINKYRSAFAKSNSYGNGNNQNFASMQSQSANTFSVGYNGPAPVPPTTSTESNGVGFGMQDALPFN